MRLLVVLFVICMFSTLQANAGFRVIREWDYLNFTWPSADVYNTATSQGLYVPKNNIIAGLKYFEDYYYITLPRMKSGVPATLTRIPAGLSAKDTAPLLEPFPSWEFNTLDDCNALQNVQNVEIDPKGQIWILDGGRTNTLNGGPMSKCQPKLVVYDIKRNMTSLTYTFPANVAGANGSFLYDIVVDDTDGGYAYITDNSGRDPGIIVFSVKQHHSWKIRHSQSMKADSNAITFRVNQELISSPINIAGIALGPKIQRNTNANNNGDTLVLSEERDVYYAPLSSLHLYSINSSVLKNERFAMNDGEYQGEVKDLGMKQSQSNAMIMDNQGVLYFTLLATDSIVRWDSKTPFQSGQQVISRDDRFLEWPSSFTFDTTGNITILVNRLNRFIFGKLSNEEPNFRLITSHVGGNSYLYDEDYKYNVMSSSPASTTSYASSSSGFSTSPEPKAEPESTSSSANNNDHDHMGHDHSSTDRVGANNVGNDQNRDTKTNEIPHGGTGRISTGFLSLLIAVIFLVL